MQPLQDQGKPTARCHPPAEGHADLEVEASLKCRSCKKGDRAAGADDQADRAREITPYKWVHPDEER